MQHFRLWVSVVPLFGLMAQAPKPQSGPGSAPSSGDTPAATRVAFLKVTIDPSRSPITMDTQAGVSAEIENVSTVPVQLFENETVFMTVPEMHVYGESRQTITGCATFPTQGNVREGAAESGSGRQSTAAPANGSPANVGIRPKLGYDVLIQPGDTYRVFLDLTRNGCEDRPQRKLRVWDNPQSWLDEKWQRVMFAPGTYKVYLDVVMHPQNQPSYRTATDARDITVSASQQMVLLGAFLGGLLAYLIKLYYGVPTQLVAKMQDALPKQIIEKTEWLVAGLFGAAMVILFSRLPDSFPVKVNANDFWGSVTLGFVFQWIGVKLLEKLPGMSASSSVPNPSVAPSRPDEQGGLQPGAPSSGISS